MSPSARSTRHLKAEGWHVAIVERYIAAIRQRKDAYGWGDLLACHPSKGLALYQVTSGANLAARVKKAQTVSGPLTAWLLAGGKLYAHGWRKVGPRGAAKRWEVREVEVTLEDLVREMPQTVTASSGANVVEVAEEAL